jgi:hypothetical protein
MRGSIFTLILALLLLVPSLSADTTILSYVIEHEIDQADNYVELTLSVQSEGKSLTNAIKSAETVL